MDAFSSPSSSSSGSGMSTEALMDQIKAQLAQAYAQELLEVCFCFYFLGILFKFCLRLKGFK